MAIWKYVLSGPPPSGTELQELRAAYGRRLTLRIDGVSDAQYTVHGRDPEAAIVTQLATDLIIYRDSTKVFRGRVITETDDLSGDDHYCQFSAINYRGMLGKRFVGVAGKDFTTIDVGAIAFTLISDSQALTGGNWGITDGAGASAGVVHTIHYDPGSNIQEMLNNLGHRATGGFEWDIDPVMAFNRYYPTRGSATGAILDFGGVVAKVHRALQSTDFANAVILTGDQVTTPTRSVSGSVGTDPQGLWETFAGYPDIKEQATLATRATWALSVTNTIRPTWTVTLDVGKWDPGTMGLGDTVKLVVITGRLSVSALHRIIEINISIGNDGDEAVTLGLVLA